MKESHVLNLKRLFKGDKMKRRFSFTIDTDDIADKIKWFSQKLFRGWSDPELWDLGNTITRFALPRLKAFKENCKHSYPASVKSEKEWYKIINEMIWGLEKTLADVPLKKKELNRMETAMALVGKYLFTMWD